MKFFNISCHISVIEDIKTIFNNLGHTITSINLSDHNWVFGRQKDNIPILANWQNNLSSIRDEFYNTYKEIINQHDAIIVDYPPTFAWLFEQSDKPIIIVMPIRNEYPFSNKPELWKQFNSYIQNIVDNGRATLVANSLYDKYYANGFINRPVEYISSLCEYTGINHKPTLDKFLVCGPSNLIRGNDIIWKGNLGRHQWSTLERFKAIVHIPHNISLMSLFEQYYAGIPLLVPSKKLIQDLDCLTQVSWNRTIGLPNGSAIPFNDVHDPNNYTKNSLDHWLEFADFYHSDALKHILKFDKIEDIRTNINNFDLNLVKEHNKQRRDKVYSQWEKIIKKIK